jgi:hypothetical protein
VTLGADRKKIAILGVLVVVGAYVLYTNVFSEPENTQRRQPRSPLASALPGVAAAPQAPVSRPAGRRGESNEFRPRYRNARPEDRPDPNAIDPTLRLDLLTKVQAANATTGTRNLFQFTTAAAMAAARSPEPRIIPTKPVPTAAPPPPTPVVAVTPPPPPINLKYFGYTSSRQGGKKRAFFIDGEEILIGTEGDLVKRRYRVVRIGVNSVVVEDTQNNNTQTLTLPEETAG